MKCHDPVLCYTTDKGKKHYRNWSLASPIIRSMHQQVFNCGKCLTCRKKRSAELAMRCVLHASLYSENCFLTLTYDETLPTYHNIYSLSDIQKFKKRLRAYCSYHLNKKIEIFNVHEYGKRGKKHWHLLVFNHAFKDQELYTIKNGNKLYTSESLSKLWPFGFSTIGDITEASAMYQAQYTQKDFKNGNVHNEKKSKSTHSGLGKQYFLQNYEQILRLGYIPFNGRKVPIPRYFEKLAHKHFSHYYEPSNFFDLPDRKRLYTPFKNESEPNQLLADLYSQYLEVRNEKIKTLENEWNEYIESFVFNKEKTDFTKSSENLHYDLNNKNNKDVL